MLGLLIHDMQNDHLRRHEESPDGRYDTPDELRALIDNHVRLLEAARGADVAVFYAAHFLRHDYADAALHATSPQRGILQAGSFGAQIIDELAPREDEYVVPKGGGMSAFTGSSLDKLLRRRGVDTLVVAGVSTHVGVDSTIRAASDLDYECIVVSDACRSNPPEKHAPSLENLSGWFARVLSTDEVVGLFADG